MPQFVSNIGKIQLSFGLMAAGIWRGILKFQSYQWKKISFN